MRIVEFHVHSKHLDEHTYKAYRLCINLAASGPHIPVYQGVCIPLSIIGGGPPAEPTQNHHLLHIAKF